MEKLGNIHKWILQYYPILVLIFLWEFVTRIDLVPPYFLPSFSSILRKIYILLANGDLFIHSGISLYRAVVGFLLGMIIGLPLGFLMGRYRFFELSLEPIISFGYPMPKVAFIPIFIYWVGIGHLSKIFTIALGTFFPILINTYYGVKSVDNLLIWAAMAMGAKPATIFRRVIIPGAMPYIFVGLNIALGVSLLLVFFAEMIGAESGLGWLIVWGSHQFETDVVFSGIFMIAFLGILINRAMKIIELRVLDWNRSKVEI